jgi:hypothetical protein
MAPSEVSRFADDLSDSQIKSDLESLEIFQRLVGCFPRGRVQDDFIESQFPASLVGSLQSLLRVDFSRLGEVHSVLPDISIQRFAFFRIVGILADLFRPSTPCSIGVMRGENGTVEALGGPVTN